MNGAASNPQVLTELVSFEHLIEAAPDAMVFTDDHGVILLVNSQTEKMFGYERNELLGKTVEILVPENSRLQHRQKINEYAHKPEPRPMGSSQYRYAQHKNGTQFPVDVSLSPATDVRPIVIACAIRDISKLVNTENALRESEKRYRHMYEHNPMMLFTLRKDGTIITINDFGAAKLGYRQEQLQDEFFMNLVSDSGLDECTSFIELCFSKPSQVHRCVLEMVHADGRHFFHRDTAQLVTEADGEKSLLVVCEDITETHLLNEKLAYQATHDALTGLINRRGFEQKLHRLTSSHSLQNSRHALGYIDLDQFKVINDTCGHIAGDELLHQLANTMSSKIRKRDSLARLGGDEFALLLEDCDIEQAYIIADELRQTVENFLFIWNRKQFRIGCSIGITPIFAAEEPITEILRNADSACYTAKNLGRNRVHVYREDDEELAKRHGEMQWIAKIHYALDNDRFRLARQEIAPVNGHANEGLHYEILLCMLSESNELIPPGTFLEAAERYDLASKIDRWVISHTFDWLAGDPVHLKQLHTCSINLSGLSVSQDEFLEFIQQEFIRTGLPANKICFEITETAAIANMQRANRLIDALQATGCRFALDDFGSGLSSFAYLKNLPVDYLKIDGIFIKDICSSTIDKAMVKSINEIGQVMGKKTIAEFVENDAILQVLKEIGIDYAQGFGISRPEPIKHGPIPGP